MKESLHDRVIAFRCFELPGQPMAGHMGTIYLVSDLGEEVVRLQADCDKFSADEVLCENQKLREALEKLLGAAAVSNDCCYGTLSTSFVQDIARAALGETK